jgi:hypothetical protein
MKLTDLDPQWITPDLFMFRSPTGHGNWLTCKRIVMTGREQMDVLWPKDGCRKGWPIVPTVPEMAWKFEGNDFETMTVTPSIDASASGNWHGFITAGAIV